MSASRTESANAESTQPLMRAEEGKGTFTQSADSQSQANNAVVKAGEPGKEVDAIDIAELQSALDSLGSGTSVSEADLHKVPWFGLFWEFGVNLLGSILGVIVVYVIMKATPRMNLKFLLVVPACLLVYLLVVTLYELIRGLVQDPEGCGGQSLLMRMPLLQAISGRRLLRLPNVSDVFILAHALERRSSEPGAFVELVANPQQMDQSRKLLVVDGEEVFPGQWVASSFYNEGKDYTQDLLAASSGDMYPPLSQRVKGWIFSDSGFQTPCFVTLKPTSFNQYLKNLFGHPAVRVLVSALLLTLGLWPGAAMLNHTHLYKLAVCHPELPNLDLQAFPQCDFVNPEGDNCKDHCSNLLDFIGEIGNRLGIEEIEFISTIGLVIVAIFCRAIFHMRHQHRLLEIKYILSSGGLSRSGEMEFMQVKSLLEDNDRFEGILSCIGSQCAAYRAELKACTSLGPEIYSGTTHENLCFWTVTQEWRGRKSAEGNCRPFTLPLSAEEHNLEDVLGRSGDVMTWADKCQIALQELAKFKNSQVLSRRAGVTDKGFKFLVSVPVTCRESLDLLMNEFFRKSSGYDSQLDAIFASEDCQDTGKGSCHVSQDFRVGPLLIPAGVCLTHVACQQANGDVCALEIGKGKAISTKDAFLQLFEGTENIDLNSVKLEGFSKIHHWASVMLPSAMPVGGAMSKLSEEDMDKKPPVDSQGLASKMKDAYVYRFSFIFQLSPSYFRVLTKGDTQSKLSLYGFVDKLFVNLQRSPVKEPSLSPQAMQKVAALQRQSWVDAAGSQYCLMAQADKSATMNKLLALIGQLLEYLGLVLLCASFVMIVPMFRHFRWESEFFPRPFTKTLIFNGLLQFIFLMGFFIFFTATARRLDLIGRALEILERRTLGSGGDDNNKAKVPAKGVSKELGNRALESNTSDPFQLFVNRTKNYDPTDMGWVSRFRAKEQALLNWSGCTRYLRVFVSGTRLTGQAILVCAAGILLVFVIVVLVQGLRGYGAISVDLSKMQAFGGKKLAQFQKSTVGALKGAAEEKAKEAGDYVANLGEGVVAASRRLLERRLEDVGPLNVTAASQSLADALEPVDAAVEEADRRDLLDAGKSLQKAAKVLSFVGDIQEITQADLLMVVMTVLLLLYSVYLLIKIARINDLADRHSSILVQAKEAHMQRQSVRERSYSDMTASKGGDIPADQTRRVDEAASSYMRMMDMSIQSSQENRSRFPLKLFSFVITQGVLIAWLSAACQPLVGQLQNVVPTLAGDTCMWLSSLTEGGVGQLSGAAGAAIASTETASGESNLVYSLVCQPLLEMLGRGLDSVEDTVEAKKDAAANDAEFDKMSGEHEKQAFSMDAGDPDPDAAKEDKPDAAKDAKRRRLREKWLVSGPALRKLVEDWWDANPGEPEAKFALVRAALEERQRSASQRLLRKMPDLLHLALEAQRRLVLQPPADTSRRPQRSSVSQRAIENLVGDHLSSGTELERW